LSIFTEALLRVDGSLPKRTAISATVAESKRWACQQITPRTSAIFLVRPCPWRSSSVTP